MNPVETCRCGHIRNHHFWFSGKCSGVGNDRLSEWDCACTSFHLEGGVPSRRATLPVPNQRATGGSWSSEIISRVWSILQRERSELVVCDARIRSAGITPTETPMWGISEKETKDEYGN